MTGVLTSAFAENASPEWMISIVIEERLMVTAVHHVTVNTENAAGPDRLKVLQQ